MSEQPVFDLRALNDHVIAVDCPTDYTRSKPSFLVPGDVEGLDAANAPGAGQSVLETKALRVEVDADRPHLLFSPSQGGVEADLRILKDVKRASERNGFRNWNSTRSFRGEDAAFRIVIAPLQE